MKFSQLTDYNMRNIFLEKSFRKCDGETISRPFSKKSKLSKSRDHYFVLSDLNKFSFPNTESTPFLMLCFKLQA